MTWALKTYASLHGSIDAEDQLPTKTQNGLLVLLDGKWMYATDVIDVSDLPSGITGGRKWASQDAWLTWENDPTVSFNRQTLLAAQGAPATLANEVVTARDKTLEEAIAEKRRQINLKRYQVLDGGVSLDVDGTTYRFDTTKQSRDDVLSVVSGLEIGIALPTGFFWTSANDEDVPMDADDVRALATAMLALGQSVHVVQRYHKTQSASLSTVAEVESYDINSLWPS